MNGYYIWTEVHGDGDRSCTDNGGVLTYTVPGAWRDYSRNGNVYDWHARYRGLLIHRGQHMVKVDEKQIFPVGVN